MNIPTVLVACGAGIATSTIVCNRVENLLKENNVRAQVVQCMISEVSSRQDGASLIISTTILPTKYRIPSIVATSYITGIGMEELDQEILTLLKN
ncbi:PTS sugar transporter subunit IIB [Halalkalibacter nanhaiisediminis]|uniref:PTS system D-arabitol-specific IIB component, Gat family (TC 4.A.5.1.2) n=1 Tax=Halalkalibacter nanhaiisediminis TaxID=688079 RepID=A0A562QRL2_9BACI|nr:PTS sugar transporter subunit IIB [Halalkalibacter nanhaiisediminis]TWI59313.1 PTS system D-arabitol-specific IIB component, Gat family (TC 4.A.5.1.2) [Halalkalibacter nanhaiisediminis]